MLKVGKIHLDSTLEFYLDQLEEDLDSEHYEIIVKAIMSHLLLNRELDYHFYIANPYFAIKDLEEVKTNGE